MNLKKSQSMHIASCRWEWKELHARSSISWPKREGAPGRTSAARSSLQRHFCSADNRRAPPLERLGGFDRDSGPLG
jgi:hypothetical protein